MGKRMKSKRPKVLHTLAGKPMIGWVLSACANAFKAEENNRIAVVIHPDMEEVATYVEAWGRESGCDRIPIVYQRERLGSGHAVMVSGDVIGDSLHGENVTILSGDVPFIGSDTLRRLAEGASGIDGAVLTLRRPDPEGYGRVVRDTSGNLSKIVEDKDLLPDQRTIREVNSGIYVFESDALYRSLPKLSNQNAQKEYYLPQIIEVILGEGGRIRAVETENTLEVSGVNDRLQLVKLEKQVYLKIAENWLREGVTVRDPENVYIEPDVTIDTDTVIEPFCFIRGKTHIGEASTIGPFCQIEDSFVGNGCVVDRSHLKGVTVADRVHIGPFARLREGTVLGEDSRIGDFVELKKTTLGKSSKAQHLSYLGDSSIGENVNIGAGTITCNYDGFHKYKTEIGDNAFIGSNTSIVAPVSIGSGAIIGAGSVIVENVEEDSLALARGLQVNKPGRAIQIRKRNQEK
jgi:bifunctional UDP-N-acetylglucosamine pyrophosphorylase/glucosamine-1-phosphate N-acetyltransferase